MSLLHSLDPGLRVAALSEFRDSQLTRVRLLRSPEKVLRGAKAWAAMASEYERLRSGPPDAFVFERMKVYQKGDNVDPADLIELTGVGAWCAALSGAPLVACYLAAEWKGTVPKDVHNKRIFAELSPPEREVYSECECPESLRHNLLDSVGIGLFQLGRLTPRTGRAGKKGSN